MSDIDKLKNELASLSGTEAETAKQPESSAPFETTAEERQAYADFVNYSRLRGTDPGTLREVIEVRRALQSLGVM